MALAAAGQAMTYSRYALSNTPANLRSEPVKNITVPTRGYKPATSEETPDQVNLSEAGLRRSRSSQNGSAEDSQPRTSQADQKQSDSPTTLSAEEQQTVQKLKIRDTEVRVHEQAHLAMAGQYAAGGPSFTYQTGPDGRRYAVGGEVPIDVSKEKTPEQTIQKMRIVRSAALAPAQPSSADQSIAAAASMKEAEARREMNSEESTTAPGQSENDQNNNPATPTERTAGSGADPVRRRNFQPIYA